MKPIPLTKQQEDKIISNLNQDIQKDYELFLKLVTNKDFSNKNYENLIKKLGIEDIYKNAALYRKLNLIVFNDEVFELLEATKTGTIIKFRDGKGTEWEIHDKNYKKINKEIRSKR